MRRNAKENQEVGCSSIESILPNEHNEPILQLSSSGITFAPVIFELPFTLRLNQGQQFAIFYRSACHTAINLYESLSCGPSTRAKAISKLVCFRVMLISAYAMAVLR